MLLEMVPTQSVLAIDVVTALIAVLPLLVIAIPQPARRATSTAGPSSYWGDLREGLRYVVRWPGLLGVILLAMMLNFWLSPSSSLTPLVVTRVFGKGAVELGWTRAAHGVGIIIGGLVLSVWGASRRRMVTSFCGIVGIGLGVIVFGVAPATQFWLLLAASFLLGLASVIANGPLFAIFQSAVAPQVQGRVFSLIGAGSAAMMPLSLLIAGPLADRVGVRFWYILGGTITIAVTLAASRIPAIMNIEQNRAASADLTGLRDL